MEYPWDLSLPQQLPPLDDEADFLNILSKQINSTAIQNNARSNPQSILALPNLSPPLSEDSSPSPPAPSRGLTQEPHRQSTNDSTELRDDMLKRKIQDINSDDDDDDIEGQPPTKSQKDQAKKGNNRRKSAGDESRLQKRKEQNRAAQRAFRERKEKHVKDLEDKVAALEAKTSTQAVENENLRDLLGRLQNENLMLKQSAFTFSAANISSGGASTGGQNNQGVNTIQRPTGSLGSSPTGSSSNKSASPASGSMSSARESPATGALGLGPGNNGNGSGFTPLLSFSSLGNGSKASSITQNSTTNPPSSTSSSNSSLPLTSFFSPPPNLGIQSPYTTIASNPLFTSYTDMASWDQFVFGDMSGGGMDSLLGTNSSSLENHNANNGSNGMGDLFNATNNYSDMIPFSGFTSGASPTTGLNQTHNKNSPSISPVAHSYNPSMSFSHMPPSTNPHAAANPALFGQYRSSSPCGGADPDQAPLPGSAHHQPNRTVMPLNGHGHVPGKKCPSTVAEMEAVIKNEPVSTFGSVDGGHSPMHEKKPGQMEMGEVWRKIKEHPHFDDIDIDSLCQELSQKARCDGTRLVLDSEEKKTQCKEYAKAMLIAKQQQQQMDNSAKSTPKMSGSQDMSPELQQQDATPSPTMTASAASTSTPKSTANSFTMNLPPAPSDPFAMYNPFLPISFQQQMQNAAALQQQQQQQLNQSSGFGTLGSIPNLPQPTNTQTQTNAGQQQQQSQPQQPPLQQQKELVAGLPMNVADLPLDLPSPGAFDSLMNFGAFSPSAFLAFDE